MNAQENTRYFTQEAIDEAQQENYQRLIEHLPDFDARTIAVGLTRVDPAALIEPDSIEVKKYGNFWAAVFYRTSTGRSYSRKLAMGFPLEIPFEF